MITETSRNVEQLWSTPDGTACILSTCDTPPYYSIALVRHAKVVREFRLYARATAQMLAAGWSELAQKGL